MATSGSTGVLPVSLKAMAAAWLPDQLVPRQERTAVSQEQEQAALSSPAAATASSSSLRVSFLHHHPLPSVQVQCIQDTNLNVAPQPVMGIILNLP